MSIFLVFVAVAVLGAVAFAVVGWRPAGDGTADPGPTRAPLRGLVEPTPSLPAVLLPADPEVADVGEIRFALALRGYRMDQVDEVLETLAAALADRDATIAELQQTQQTHLTHQDQP
ncbi:DivIVA domain-containing protein [Arthrobacter sp. Hz1]